MALSPDQRHGEGHEAPREVPEWHQGLLSFTSAQRAALTGAVHVTLHFRLQLGSLQKDAALNTLWAPIFWRIRAYGDPGSDAITVGTEFRRS